MKSFRVDKTAGVQLDSVHKGSFEERKKDDQG
jgi:hypothetical protein